MDLHSGETVIFEGRPSWRSIIGFYITGLIGAVAIGVLAGVIDKTSTGVIVWIVLFAGVILVGWLKRVSTKYTITSERLHIQRGLLSRAQQQTSLDRVQNVNTRQSLLERILRVGTVDFDTAGTDDSDFTFAGVASPGDVVHAVDVAQRERGGGQTAAPGAV